MSSRLHACSTKSARSSVEQSGCGRRFALRAKSIRRARNSPLRQNASSQTPSPSRRGQADFPSPFFRRGQPLANAGPACPAVSTGTNSSGRLCPAASAERSRVQPVSPRFAQLASTQQVDGQWACRVPHPQPIICSVCVHRGSFWRLYRLLDFSARKPVNAFMRARGPSQDKAKNHYAAPPA